MVTATIITADIVNSTGLSRKQETKLRNALTDILKPHVYEFYRGDSFQAYIKDSGDGLKIALQIRLAGKKLTPELSVSPFDVRMSLGIGSSSTPVKTLKTTTGEAFTLSGRAFDEMRDTETRLVMQSSHELVNSTLKVTSCFVDYIFQHLTTKQAMVVSELLEGSTQIDVAKKLKKSQPTINKHAQSAGWPQIAILLQEYRQVVKQV